MRILVVDDDEQLRTIIARMLEIRGHSVAQACAGSQAIQMIRREPPDVVLTDLVMPFQDGLAVIMMLRKELPTVPAIAMSGGLMHASVYLNLAKKLGARAVLAKPFTSQELYDALRTAVPAF